MEENSRPLSSGDIASQLFSLGVRPGDAVYVRANLFSIGRIASPAKETALDGFLQILGEEGLLVVPAFTQLGKRWSRHKPIFSPDAPSDAGALTNAVLAHQRSVRSTHPSHSFAAIGRQAREFLHGHSDGESAFFPIGKLIGLGGKMLVIGCNGESPGFSTVHFAQHELRLSQRHLSRYLKAAKIRSGERIALWHPTEDPGCSRGFDKMYRHYIRDENFVTGYLGKAFTILVRAADAYRVDRRVLEEDPTAVICDDPGCLSCRVLRTYNLGTAPMGLFRALRARISRR